MRYHMPPKYIGLFSKEDKHGKLQWKITSSNSREEIDTSIEIMSQSGYTVERGFAFDYRYNGYLPMV